MSSPIGRRRGQALGVLLWAISIATSAAEPPTVRLRLIGLNDFHGQLQASDRSQPVPTGGAAALAGLVQTLRTGAPHSLTLSSGDLIGAAPLVSSLFHHEPTIAVMNALGLEAAALGNHELDGRVAELQRLAAGGCAADAPGHWMRSCADGPYAGARFSLLAANVRAANGQPLFAPFVVKTYDGVRVGLIGAVTRNTPRLVAPAGVAGLRFDDEATAINRAAAQLRAQGVRAVVLAIHEGGETGDPGQPGDPNDSRCPNARGRIFDIAARLTPDIGVIFSAHTHQSYRCMVDGRLIVQAAAHGRGLAVVDVELDAHSGRLLAERTHSWNLPVLNEHTPAAVRERLAAATPAPYDLALRQARSDATVAREVARYVQAAAPLADQLVGRIGAPFTRHGARSGPADSAAGRLVADAQLTATRAPSQGGAQLALMNPGGLRSDVTCAAADTPPCDITFGQLFALQPFGNRLVVLALSGDQLRMALASQSAGQPLIPSAGFTYTWQATAPPGARARDLRLHGEPVQPQQTYRVTVNSFMAEGGDGFFRLHPGTERVVGAVDIDALVSHLQPSRDAQPALPSEPRILELP